MNFQDKVALITGGGTGIGRSAAESLVALGAKTITEGVEAGEFQSRLRPRHMAAYILAALEGGLLIARTPARMSDT